MVPVSVWGWDCPWLHRHPQCSKHWHQGHLSHYSLRVGLLAWEVKFSTIFVRASICLAMAWLHCTKVASSILVSSPWPASSGLLVASCPVSSLTNHKGGCLSLLEVFWQLGLCAWAWLTIWNTYSHYFLITYLFDISFIIEYIWNHSCGFHVIVGVRPYITHAETWQQKCSTNMTTKTMFIVSGWHPACRVSDGELTCMVSYSL